jgi:hypothetical protein
MNDNMNHTNIILPPPTARYNSKKTLIDRYYGFDTEALTTGEPFTICFSDNTKYTASMIPKVFFTKNIFKVHFFCYNLKYEEGAILYHLPMDILRILKETGRIKYNNYSYRIIPGKNISISNGRRTIKIWDIYPIYMSSLEKAASKYLNKHKTDIGSKIFTLERVLAEWDEITDYCIIDAKLTEELVTIFLNNVTHIMHPPDKLYSVAYLSGQYFIQHTTSTSYKKILDYNPGLNDAACKTYHGGKFECYIKGIMPLYEYDISSAYPYEIAQLKDLKGCHIEYTDKVDRKADYAIIKALLNIDSTIYHPYSIKKDNLVIYPSGKLRTYLTLNEYLFAIRNNIPVWVVECWNIYCNSNIKPFEEEIMKLYALKEQAAANNDIVYKNLYKIILNSFYGKMCQSTPIGKKYKVSTFFNPIYASAITANVRIRISELCNTYQDVAMVATDAIFSQHRHDEICSEGLGGMTKKYEGTGVILGCGVYELDNEIKLRGFNVKEMNMHISDFYTHDTNKIPITQKQVRYWKTVLHRNMSHDFINFFDSVEKELRLNFDKKRIWLNNWKTFKDIPTRNIYSSPYDIDFYNKL